MKYKFKQIILPILAISLSIIACGGSKNKDTTNELSSAEETSTQQELSYEGIIRELYWDHSFGEGGIRFYQNPDDLELKLRLNDGELKLNPKSNDIIDFNGTEQVLNARFINKKVMVTYKAKGHNTLNPKEREILKIDIIGEYVPDMPSKTISGNIIGVTTQDSVCVTIQAGMDEPVIDSYRIWTEGNVQKVDISSIKDIFTHKNYSTQLNPKYSSARIMLTLEPKVISQRRIYNGQNRSEILNSYCVTRIEPAQ